MKTKLVTVNALIAALYTVLTLVSSFFGIAYGPVQLRLSEIFALLPAVNVSFIPGVVLGCAISNLFSFNMLDCVFGTAASLIAAVFTYLLRKHKIRGIPVFSAIPPIIVNSLIIGAQITLFLSNEATFTAFVYSAITVALGQTVVMCLGLILFPFFKKILDKF